MEHRDERIVVETDRYRITGMVSIPKEGYRSRVSDFLNLSERSVLALTDVEIAPIDSVGTTERRAFMALSVAHVVLVMPAEGPAA